MLQCFYCRQSFEEDYEYFVHTQTVLHEENRTLGLDPEEEYLLNKYN